MDIKTIEPALPGRENVTGQPLTVRQFRHTGKRLSQTLADIMFDEIKTTLRLVEEEIDIIADYHELIRKRSHKK
jgi:hypothetical protein